MKLILIYDIELKDKKDQKRLNWAKKISRRYLHHVQKSVFEGEITLAQLARLESEILGVVDINRDSVIIYKLPDGARWERKILTNTKNPSDNII